MHVMVATDGAMDPEAGAALAAKLAADGGQVTVFTVVEVPRRLLADMRSAADGAETSKLQEVSVEYRADQADDPRPSSWIGDDAVVERYVAARIKAATAGLVAQLDAAGVAHEVVGEESENCAQAIIDAAQGRDVDVLCVGTRGLGRFEGLLGSVSTKVARRAGCAVLLVR